MRTWGVMAVLSLVLAGCADGPGSASLVWEASSPPPPEHLVQYALRCPPGSAGEAPRCQTPLGGPLDQRRLTSMAIDPTDPDHIVAALPVNIGRTTVTPDAPDATPDHVRFLHSMDGGTSWRAGSSIALPWTPTEEGSDDIDVQVWFSASGRLHVLVRADQNYGVLVGSLKYFHFWSDGPDQPWQASIEFPELSSYYPLLRAVALSPSQQMIIGYDNEARHLVWYSQDDGASWLGPKPLGMRSCEVSRAVGHNGSAWFACQYRDEEDDPAMSLVQVQVTEDVGGAGFNVTATGHSPQAFGCEVYLWTPWNVMAPSAYLGFHDGEAMLIARGCAGLGKVTWSEVIGNWSAPVELASGYEGFHQDWRIRALEVDALGGVHTVVEWWEPVRATTGAVTVYSGGRNAAGYAVAAPSGNLVYEQRLGGEEGDAATMAPNFFAPSANHAAFAFGEEGGWLGWSRFDSHSLAAVEYILPEGDSDEGDAGQPSNQRR